MKQFPLRVGKVTSGAQAMRSTLDDFLQRSRTDLYDGLRRRGLEGATVEARVKTLEAIARKRAHRPAGKINDMAGLRVIVPYRGLIREAVAAVRVWARQNSLTQVGMDDYFERPGAGGYHALHFDYEVADPERLGLPKEAGVEVQVTTALLAAVARISHEVVYRAPSRDEERASAADCLARLADDALELDERLERLMTKVAPESLGGTSEDREVARALRDDELYRR